MTDILQDAVNALVLAKGNISEASRALGLPRPTLNSRLEKAKLNNIKPTLKAPGTEAALTEQKITYDLQIKELKQQVDELARENITATAFHLLCSQILHLCMGLNHQQQLVLRCIHHHLMEFFLDNPLIYLNIELNLHFQRIHEIHLIYQ